jgi:hypothetical protein
MGMTAEIAIMNKGAIALAADSAVTIGSGNKTYNTANKLFMLSKLHPVGIMIYGNAELMGYPWETLIKIYREGLGYDKFDSVSGYADDFLSFLESGNIITEGEQIKFFKRSVSSCFNSIKVEISKEIDFIIKSKTSAITKTVLTKVINTIVRKRHEFWKESEFIDKTDNKHCNAIVGDHSVLIDEIIKLVFQELPINKVNAKRLREIAAFIFCKKRFSSSNTGVVIAGFGDKEIFPSLIELNIEGIFENIIKYSRNSSKIDTDCESRITPFAQDEMVRAFMEGIDPYFNSTIKGYVSKAFEEYNNSVIENLPGKEEDKAGFKEKLSKLSKKINEEFVAGMRGYSNEEHISPIMDAVAVLPKEELAIMAESLVNITSFKRKMTLDVESVGGPIDVAIISKGDGFVWVKRKHYFKPDLNHAFFTNYFRGITGGQNDTEN